MAHAAKPNKTPSFAKNQRAALYPARKINIGALNTALRFRPADWGLQIQEQESSPTAQYASKAWNGHDYRYNNKRNSMIKIKIVDSSGLL